MSAQPSIHMSSVVGFNGFYSKNQWVPVTMTIVNNGPATNAELDIVRRLWRRGQNGARYPALASATSGVSDRDQTNRGTGAHGGRETVECVVNGQPVASSKLSGTALGSVSLVGVLSKDAQLARVLTGLTDGEAGIRSCPSLCFQPTFQMQRICYRD